MTSYLFALQVHSLLRLGLTLVCAWIFFSALRAWLGKSATSVVGRLWLVVATILADLQLVLGLLLYFSWSPNTSQARANFAGAMKDPTLRFWAVEHSSAMLLAVVCVHVGKILARRAQGDASRHRRLALWFGIALALILLMSPWPFSGVSRPIWPFVDR